MFRGLLVAIIIISSIVLLGSVHAMDCCCHGPMVCEPYKKGRTQYTLFCTATCFNGKKVTYYPNHSPRNPRPGKEVAVSSDGTVFQGRNQYDAIDKACGCK